MTPKAVMFTHFASLQYKDDMMDSEQELVETYSEIIKPYLVCNQIGLVYAYVDWAVKEEVPQLTNSENISVRVETLKREKYLIGILRKAEEKAKLELGINLTHKMKFRYIGLQHLLDLFDSIIQFDPKLLELLHGMGNRFTYDSPKFVEAIIRLARGHTDHLAGYPIIRIDEDAQPNTESINILLTKYHQATRDAPFFFFSGAYGVRGGAYDPINDHAVRVHWFVDPKSGEPRLEPIRTFLTDLTELGATQRPDMPVPFSSALQKLFDDGRQRSKPERKFPQVISGSGLIMSSKAVNLLPPFMNFTELTTWVDDHLKRRLHEALKDIGLKYVECVEEAIIKQDRGPCTEDYTRQYFDRLLRGCMFRRLITEISGEPTAYTKFIGEIVQIRVSENDLRLSDAGLGLLKIEMLEHAGERYDEVIKCWAADEFHGFLSFNWAHEKLTDKKKIHKQPACKALVDDAINYIKLVHKWPIFTRAIERLPFAVNDWLYETVE